MAVPFASVGVALLVSAAVLAITGHDPVRPTGALFDAAFIGERRAGRTTLISATPLLFTGLAAAVAFRMQLCNIGAEGQLYIGAICGAGAAIWLGPRRDSTSLLTSCSCVPARPPAARSGR